MKNFRNIKSLSELHNLLGIYRPKHPSISLVYTKDIKWKDELFNNKFVLDFYTISHKNHHCEMLYGRNFYDFEEGTLVFTSPDQVIETSNKPDMDLKDGWTLFFQPDFLLNSNLNKNIKSYSFFSYSSHEALHLSEEEKDTIMTCVKGIEKEYEKNIDQHSRTVIISSLELLLNYCNRFYDRQFYTRASHEHDIISRVENCLYKHFNSEESLKRGIPTVKQIAEKVHLSPNYLSDLLKKETGKSTQEHIHYHLIEKAKEMLLSSNASVSEIAFQLGFEYPQYFGNLFKKKAGLSPLKYRQFN